MEYIIPTNIKSNGDLTPCINITETIPLNPKNEEENNIIGIVII